MIFCMKSHNKFYVARVTDARGMMNDVAMHYMHLPQLQLWQPSRQKLVRSIKGGRSFDQLKVLI